MPALSTVLQLLSQGAQVTANVLGAVMPGQAPDARERPKKPGCKPCERRAELERLRSEARSYLGREQPPKPKPRARITKKTVGAAVAPPTPPKPKIGPSHRPKAGPP